MDMENRRSSARSKAILRDLNWFEKDLKQLDECYPKLVRECPNYFAAVYKGKLYIEPTWAELLKKAKKSRVPVNQAAWTLLVPLEELERVVI